MDHERRAAYARAGFGEQFLTGHSDAEHRVADRFGCGLHRPADAVLDLLARVRLGEAPREEELDEADVVLVQSAGGLGPLRVGFDRVLERGHIALRVVGDERHRGADVHDRVDPVGVIGGEDRRPQRTGRQSHQRRTPGLGHIHDRERVVSELARAVRIGAGRPVRAPVAAPVERHHPQVPGQVGDLRLPEARMNNRPSRQQQHRPVAGPVDLVEDAHAAALDVTGLIRISGAGLFGPPGARSVRGRHGLVGGPRHGRTSNTRLNGVSATRCALSMIRPSPSLD